MISARRHTRGWWRGFPPKSDMAQGIFRAYWVGGVICALGQTINDLFAYGLKRGRAERFDRDEHLPDFCVVAADGAGRIR